MELNNQTYSAPVLPVPGTLLLPGTKIKLKNLTRFDVQRLQNELFVALPIKNGISKNEYEMQDFYPYGVTCKVLDVDHTKEGWEILAQSVDKVLVKDLVSGRFPAAMYEVLADEEDLPETSKMELLDYMKDTVAQMAQSFRGGDYIYKQALQYEDINQLITYLAQYMPLNAEERNDLLSMSSIKERSLRFIDYLLRQKEIIALNFQINEKFSEQANKYYREQALKKQLQAIQEELAMSQEEGEEKEDYASRIMKASLPKEVEKALLEDARKLETASQNSSETDLIKNYLDFALDLPWKKEEIAKVDLKEARKVLDSRHYGMDKVKERIIQHLAVMRLRNTNKGTALLLVGPPGTGKTSLARSIASALNREYTRMSLGGIRDESEIRGHRRTYIGAMAGRVLQSMKRAGTTNPVMVLDELDKMMQGGFSGDPMAAMLEVLDPEQNDSFTDHYLDLPYDLSDVFFVATANSLDTIPAPLLDRMEIIEVSSYTAEEKFHIAKDHLLKEVLADHGIREDQLLISDEAIASIVEDYTMEAGCRGLKKRLEHIARFKSEEIIDSTGPVKVEVQDLEKIFGPVKRRHEKVAESNPVGVVTGLAWTPVGGEVLFIETTDMPGSSQMIVTGQLGDVMKESARIAMSVLKSRLPLNTLAFKERDIHIHVPAGSTPKDGPSAGITLFSALASLATGIPIDSHIAMTGELTLRGEVLPIGGLKEKLFGAQRAGITKVLIPFDNKADLEEVPASVKEKLNIVPVKTVEDVLRETLNISLPPMEHVLMTDAAFHRAA